MKDEFDELFQEHENEQFNKLIKRRINKKIYFKFLKGLLVVCVLLAAIQLAVKTYNQQVYYNPNSEERFIKANTRYECAFLLSDYLQLSYPGLAVLLAEDDNEFYQDQGKGTYTFKLRLQDSLEQITIGSTNTTVEISQSQLTMDNSNNQVTHIIDEFKDPNDQEFTEVVSLTDLQKDIQEMPESTYLSVSLSFVQYQDLDSIVALMEKYPDVDFNYLALKDQNITDIYGIAGGMALKDYQVFDFTKKANKAYPNYYLEDDDTLTGTILKQKYLSKLKLLIDHPDFVETLKENYGITLTKLKANYQKAKKELLAYGIRVNIKKQDLLNILRNENIAYAYINDLKLSQYQKN